MAEDPASLAASIFRFVQETELMKNQTRTAWGSSGRQESVAEHSWRLALLALVVAPHLESVDPRRLIELCIVHDLGENYEGDISAPQQNAASDKSEAERSAVQRLAALLQPDDEKRIAGLFAEYDEARTPEARAAKALDKIETIVQHNQGDNPASFDYDFNLGYGAGLAHDGELLRALRSLADESTRDASLRARRTQGPQRSRPDCNDRP